MMSNAIGKTRVQWCCLEECLNFRNTNKFTSLMRVLLFQLLVQPFARRSLAYTNQCYLLNSNLVLALCMKYLLLNFVIITNQETSSLLVSFTLKWWLRMSIETAQFGHYLVCSPNCVWFMISALVLATSLYRFPS